MSPWSSPMIPRHDPLADALHRVPPQNPAPPPLANPRLPNEQPFPTHSPPIHDPIAAPLRYPIHDRRTPADLNCHTMDPVKADRSLLTTLHERASAPEELYACINAHGLYNRVQYVLRLSPEVHRRLSRFSTQILKLNRLTSAEIQASSTLLHETLHWWQHIGSTAGLMLSLSTPLQSHASFPHLRMFLRQVGPKKSILKFAMNNASNSQSAPAMRTTNTIVNNYKDVSFFQIIATRPRSS